MVEGGPHARASHLLYLWIQDALNVACTATHTAATTIASQQATEAGELDAFLAALNYMGSRRIKLPEESVKSPDGSFWPTPAPCPSIIFLVAMSQSWDSVLEEAEIYLTNLYPALVRVVVLKMCHKAPDRVVRGGDVRIAAVECVVAEDDDEGGGPTLRGRVVLDRFIQKDGQMCHNTSTEDLDLIFALADFAHRNDRTRVARLGKVVRLPFVKLQALVREIEHIFADDSPIDTNLGPEKYPGLRIKPNLQRPAS
ncbi:hypothetical protein UCRPA7_2670 [Phaeoacremonium minimum UCRPA7]|uniref:Uncharacterized protein n=1 Tax=Phaeoacremonium minimum (strain UCR-PA7) TaxID=1286976 RepID=R8BRC7_PHAM7|nr:hypothetical protein UCRPA7_2670 [Phaeoacremonium minimum UCRPA7]EOO01845.1 hypothetical protein UCRPA7_2670 [Phaeoacremonium minimum UCRPA7]